MLPQPVEPDFEPSPDAYTVRLEQFRGPARSADSPHQEERGEHLRHPDRAHHGPVSGLPRAACEELNLDVAGEFLVMAATLIHIKSRMLLPRPDAVAGGSRGGSARGAGPPAARVPEVQGRRRTCCTSARSCAAPSGSGPTSASPTIAGEEYEPEVEVDLFSLMAAFKAVLDRAKQRPKVALPGRADLDRGRASSSCSRGCRRPRPAASRTCSRTPTRARTSSSRSSRCSR